MKKKKITPDLFSVLAVIAPSIQTNYGVAELSFYEPHPPKSSIDRMMTITTLGAPEPRLGAALMVNMTEESDITINNNNNHLTEVSLDLAELYSSSNSVDNKSIVPAERPRTGAQVGLILDYHAGDRRNPLSVT